MSTHPKANVLSASAIKKSMPACMVYALVQSMTFMVDTIVAGHFLGNNAVAAIAIGMPFIGLMLSFTSVILHGGFLNMLGAMGKSDMKNYERLCSITLTATIAVGLIFVIFCMTGTNIIVGIGGGAKAAAEARVLSKIYIRSSCLMIFFFCVGSVFQLISASFGYQTERMLSSLINIIVNIVISIASVYMLSDQFKIAGLGIGSAAGAFAQMVSAYILMKRKNIQVTLRPYPVNKQNVMDALSGFRKGLPSSVDLMLDSVSGSIVNNIILSIFANGTSVLALVAIMKTIYSIVKTVGRGTSYASEPLIGILHGGRDNEAIKKVFYTSIRTGVVYAAGLAVFLILLKTPILNFYNVADYPEAHTGLILIAISGMLLVIPFVFTAIYEATGHLSLALLVGVIPDSVLYPSLIAILHGRFGVTGIWFCMCFNFIPFFIVFYLLFVAAFRKFPVPLENLLMLKKFENLSVALDISIPADSEDISFVSENLQNFFSKHNCPGKVAFACALCMEEIAADYRDHTTEAAKNSAKSAEYPYMDIKAFRDKEAIEIILRNYDEPYNPFPKGYNKEDFSKIGINIVQKIASDISYSYAYKLNVVTITINA